MDGKGRWMDNGAPRRRKEGAKMAA